MDLIEEQRQQIVNLHGELSIRDSQLKNNENTITNLQNNVDVLIQEMEDMQLSRDSCKKDNVQASQKLIQLEQELFESKKTGMKLIEQLRNCDHELEKVKQTARLKIRELHTLSESLARKQPIYIGKSMDQIDLSLSDFLNMYPEREDLKILFVRESEGVYKFG